jgi:exodeoxyribonuclease VII large subunit
MVASRAIKEIYPVSRLVREARVALEGSFPLVWVEGEVSNLAMPASGHIYFTLKDEVAQVRCAMFRNRNRQLRFTPKNGMQVLLRVRVSLYEGRGEFQLSVEHMEEAGSGALQRAYEALKFRLGDEGLFDQAHKKELPTFPSTIGIVSSPDGAAVHDILTVLERRFPAVEVILYPVAVQGEASISQIVSMITLASTRMECDVLIVGRGGGSMEDLWSFNDERVARAIFECAIPVISAVGHEVDFTIADFVADVRAPTPSAAAELAVQDVTALSNQLRHLGQRFNIIMSNRIQNNQTFISQLSRRLGKPQERLIRIRTDFERLEKELSRAWYWCLNQKQQQLDRASSQLTHPQAKLDVHHHKVNALVTRLHQSQKFKLLSSQQEFKKIEQRFASVSPLPNIKESVSFVSQLKNRLETAMNQKLMLNRTQLDSLTRTLAVVSPLNTLERGYSITSREGDDEVIHSTTQVALGDVVKIRLQQGQIHCEVKSKDSE